MRDGQICKAWDILPMIRHASLRGADRGAKPTARSRWGGARSWGGRLNRPGGRIGRSRPLTSGRSQFRHVERLPVFSRVPEVILNLQVKPAFSAGVEGDRETDGYVRADSCTPVKDAGQRLSTHAERSRSVRDGQVQGFQAQLPEHLTRVRRIMHLHSHLLAQEHAPGRVACQKQRQHRRDASPPGVDQQNQRDQAQRLHLSLLYLAGGEPRSLSDQAARSSDEALRAADEPPPAKRVTLGRSTASSRCAWAPPRRARYETARTRLPKAAGCRAEAVPLPTCGRSGRRSASRSAGAGPSFRGRTTWCARPPRPGTPWWAGSRGSPPRPPRAPAPDHSRRAACAARNPPGRGSA